MTIVISLKEKQFYSGKNSGAIHAKTNDVFNSDKVAIK